MHGSAKSTDETKKKTIFVNLKTNLSNAIIRKASACQQVDVEVV